MADITLPVWLFVSQWVLLFALGFLIIMMYRQVAYLEQVKDHGAERNGLPVGEKAPSFDYTPVNRGASGPVRFLPEGKWSLLIFADPGCVSCQQALLALERLLPHFTPSMQVLVATSAESALIAASDAFRHASVEIGRVAASVSTRLYSTSITPFAFLIDPEGVTRAKGAVTDESSLRKVVRQGDQKPVNVAFTVS
jgi:hypothetical protein